MLAVGTLVMRILMVVYRLNASWKGSRMLSNHSNRFQCDLSEEKWSNMPRGPELNSQ